MLSEVPMDCKDTVLADPLLKYDCVKYLTFEENIWKPYNDNSVLLRTLALHLHGNEILEEEFSEIFSLFLEKTSKTDRANFQGVCMEEIARVEDIVLADIFLYDIDIVDGSMFGELAKRTLVLHGNNVIIVTFALSLIITLSSKLVVVHCVMIPSEGLIL